MAWLSKSLDLIFADTCALCRQVQSQQQPHLLCHLCWASLPRITVACRHCAVPLPMPGLCGRCVQDPLVPGFCIVALEHVGDTRVLIHQLKYANGLRAGRTLAHALLAAVTHNYHGTQMPQCLIPVPLSWRNQTRRGYNQASVLAYTLAKHIGLPLLSGVIKRRHGPAQHTLSQQQRLRGQNNTFTLNKPLPYKHVAIVDDVLTTGGTVTALSRLLSDAGTQKIDVWCASRALIN
jgi:ComF family protein